MTRQPGPVKPVLTQRPAFAAGRRESSEGRLGPLSFSQQPTATIQANPGPPTSAVRGWPHWERPEIMPRGRSACLIVIVRDDFGVAGAIR